MNVRFFKLYVRFFKMKLTIFKFHVRFFKLDVSHKILWMNLRFVNGRRSSMYNIRTWKILHPTWKILHFHLKSHTVNLKNLTWNLKNLTWNLKNLTLNLKNLSKLEKSYIKLEKSYIKLEKSYMKLEKSYKKSWKILHFFLEKSVRSDYLPQKGAGGNPAVMTYWQLLVKFWLVIFQSLWCIICFGTLITLLI